MNEIESIKFKLNPIITSDDGNKYEVIIQIPMALGWIEDVNFIIKSILLCRMLKNLYLTRIRNPFY